jgi:hypothetical protein
MALTIELPEQIEKKLQTNATKSGIRFDIYLIQILEKATQAKPKRTKKPISETALLKKINLGISESEWTTYTRLIQLRNSAQLSEIEYQDLTDLGEKIEQANAKRLRYLAELAKLRQVGLSTVMQDLGIKPIEL